MSNAGAVTTLANSGIISGGNGGVGASFDAAGGVGVSNASQATIGVLTNATGATISGGQGGGGSFGGGPGGAGVSNFGTITSLTNSGTISAGNAASGAAGGAGVSNYGTIATLANNGTISAGNAGYDADNAAGGAGVENSGGVGTLTNRGTVSGGAGGGGFYGVAGAGGAGVSNAMSIATLTNSGVIDGGAGGAGLSEAAGGAGGAGVSNSGTITTLTNEGALRGGAGGAGWRGQSNGGVGGAGASNVGAIATLTNRGTITGGNGGLGFFFGLGRAGGAGGAGMSNAGTVTSLINRGAIVGGDGSVGLTSSGAGGAGLWNVGEIDSLANGGTIVGGRGASSSSGLFARGAGGAGISNSGTIAALTNSGTIERGLGGKGAPPGAPGDAIYSAGPNASIGPITNSGHIIGNVEIDNQPSVTVDGGMGTTFGSWTKGTITIGAGNLTFARGNTALGDNIVVRGGKGTVFNEDPLMFAAPQTITGNFDQSNTGLLDFGLAGDMPGKYGALAISGSASLDGGLGIDLTGGFTLATDDSFDILNFGSLKGPGFDALALDGVGCSPASADSWSCSGGVLLKEEIAGASLDLFVARDPAALWPRAASSAIPEPSTWAMLALGFLGLGGLGLRKRNRAGEIGPR